MRKIKIGIDARMFSDAFTGIGRYNFELTKEFFKHKIDEKNREIEWVIFMNNPEFSQFDFPKNVKKVLVNSPHYSFSEQIKFAWILYKENCDLVFFSSFNFPILYFKKFITTIHDITISFFPGKKMNNWWRKLAYNLVIKMAIKNSRKIITVSQNTKKDLIDNFSVNPQKIKVIYNGISADFKLIKNDEKQQIRKKFNLSKKYFLYTGNWREHKNLVGLIKSFKKVLEKNPQKDLNLVITGKPDPFYSEVLETIKNLSLEKTVKTVGLVDFSDLVNLVGGADIFVFPSFYEGFGIPPLESMKSNVPVVCSNSSSLPEVCGKAAAYFDPKNIEEMSNQIDKVLNDENFAKNLIKKGLENIKRFSWEKSARETISCLFSII